MLLVVEIPYNQTRTAAGNLGDLIIHNASGGILEDLVNAGLVADMTDLMKDSKYLNTYKDALILLIRVTLQQKVLGVFLLK